MSPARRSNFNIVFYSTFPFICQEEDVAHFLSVSSPLSPGVYKTLIWFSFVVAAVVFSSTFPPPKPLGRQPSNSSRVRFFITTLLPLIFSSVCASVCTPPVTSLIFTPFWGGKCSSIYWHIYFMCLAAHGVIKHKTFSPFKQYKLSLTPNFPCHPSTSLVTRSVHKTICSCTDA